MTGRIIVINGPSSSGKTSILRALQAMQDTPWLDMGIDRFIFMLPKRYLDRPLWDDVLGRASEAGGTGQRLVWAMHHAIAAAAGTGFDILADHVLVEAAWVEECARVFAERPAYLVGIRCPLEILEERERARKDRTLGQARAQFDVIHRYCRYDLEVDTSRFTPEECAAQIIARLEAPPHALAQLAR